MLPPKSKTFEMDLFIKFNLTEMSSPAVDIKVYLASRPVQSPGGQPPKEVISVSQNGKEVTLSDPVNKSNEAKKFTFDSVFHQDSATIV